MNNYIIWKDINSNTIDGLLISELPSITKPQMRYKETQIDGVDGSIIEELGYESYNKQLKIGLHGNFDIDEIVEYFSGQGQVIFSNEPDRYYNASILKQIDYERLLRFRTATVEFKVQPYKYSAVQGVLTVNATSLSEYDITNIGNTESPLKLTLKGSGKIEMSLNGISMFTYDFPTDDTEVVIDAEKQDAYLNGVLKNRNMNGRFIVLDKGVNTLTWIGNITEIKFEKWSRWI